MRLRSLSILATSALCALLGCPLETADTGEAGSVAAPVAEADGSLRDGAGHDDPVDSRSDDSWASAVQGEAGAAGLRLLMTDAPIEADNVFVTFCGIYVEPAAASDEIETEGSEDSPADALKRAEETPRGPAANAPRGAGTARADHAQTDPAPAGEVPAADPESPDGTDARELEPQNAQETDASPSGAERAQRDAGGHDGWHVLSDQCQTLDLLTLRDGVTEAVGIAALPPGDYGQIRLVLSRASIVIGGFEHELDVPSGAQSGIKVGGGFTLAADGATTITLDFDAGRSVHYAAGTGYMMSPVIDVIDVSAQETEAPQAPSGDSDGSEAADPTDGSADETDVGSAEAPAGEEDVAGDVEDSADQPDVADDREENADEAGEAEAVEGQAAEGAEGSDGAPG